MNTHFQPTKIVYYGPPYTGKGRNLEFLYNHLAGSIHGSWQSVATETERTIRFSIENISAASALRYVVSAIDGPTLYKHSRLPLLSEADAVVFVVDGSRERLEENRQYLTEVLDVIKSEGKNIADFPMVLQYINTNLDRSLNVYDLNIIINTFNWKYSIASPFEGIGLIETFKLLIDIL